MWGSRPLSDWHAIWDVEWYPERNHPCQISCWSVKGFLGGRTPKSAISYTYWNDSYNSPALPCRLWQSYTTPNINLLNTLRFYVPPTPESRSFQRRSSHPVSWLGTEKLNLIQQLFLVPWSLPGLIMQIQCCMFFLHQQLFSRYQLLQFTFSSVKFVLFLLSLLVSLTAFTYSLKFRVINN